MISLLTEEEVAGRLHCTPRNVRRLRTVGRIPYLPGRPPLIEEVDLLAYIDAKQREAEARAAPKPVVQRTEEEEMALARRRARLNWMRRTFRAQEAESRKSGTAKI